MTSTVNTVTIRRTIRAGLGCSISYEATRSWIDEADKHKAIDDAIDEVNARIENSHSMAPVANRDPKPMSRIPRLNHR